MWIITAGLSALFAGITSVLAKCGIKNTDSDVATAIRTLVVLVFSWIIVFIVGSAETIAFISGRSFLFLILSGVSTGISWLFYFRALAIGDVNTVAPIDKSSTVLTAVFAIVLFHETNYLIIKLVCICTIFAGTLLMIRKPKDENNGNASAACLIYALISAVFAALTSIFAKIGIENVESNLGTAIRTGVVLIIAWCLVFAKGKHRQIAGINKRELLFILLSGVTTGASWLCYYNAIQTGVVSVVVPIDKLSIVVTILFSLVFLKEKLTAKAWIGLFFIVAGTVVMALFA